MDKNLFFYELEGRGYTFHNKNWDEAKHGFEDDMLNMAWEMWSSGKASAQREGYNLVPLEPPEGMDIKICDLVNHRVDVFEADRIYKAMIGAAE